MKFEHRAPLAAVVPLSALCFAMAACVSVGRHVDAGLVKALVAGKTTQTDVEKSFGEPFRTGVDSGDATWTYVDYHLGLMGPQRATDLVVKFNADGTVKSYTFNTTEPSK